MKKALIAIFVVVVVFIGIIIALNIAVSDENVLGGKLAEIRIDGIISNQEDLLGSLQVNSEDVNSKLEKAEKDTSVKAILLYINSPGGSPVASDEISSKIKTIEKPVIAYISDSGTSGAYWIASAADGIVAHPLSMTCSIGAFTVVGEFTGFFEEYGLNFTVIKSAEYKDVGSPYKPLEKEEELILQRVVDKLHTAFVEEVAENRGMDEADVWKIADGKPCLGEDALEYGLVDYLGDKEDAIKIAEDITGTELTIKKYEEKKSLLSSLLDVDWERSFYAMGIGLGQGMKETNEPGIRLLS